MNWARERRDTGEGEHLHHAVPWALPAEAWALLGVAQNKNFKIGSWHRGRNQKGKKLRKLITCQKNEEFCHCKVGDKSQFWKLVKVSGFHAVWDATGESIGTNYLTHVFNALYVVINVWGYPPHGAQGTRRLDVEICSLWWSSVLGPSKAPSSGAGW